MSYTLEQFSTDCRTALHGSPEPAGLEAVRQCVERACADKDFLNEHLGPDNHSSRKILYTDPELGFCIIAHVYEGEKASQPHDHGPSWAIYGQAVGTTEMTDWRIVAAAEDGKPGKVEALRTYSLEPGQARAYHRGDVHSPGRTDATRLIRVEGLNMDEVQRGWYDPV